MPTKYLRVGIKAFVWQAAAAAGFLMAIEIATWAGAFPHRPAATFTPSSVVHVAYGLCVVFSAWWLYRFHEWARKLFVGSQCVFLCYVATAFALKLDWAPAPSPTPGIIPALFSAIFMSLRSVRELVAVGGDVAELEKRARFATPITEAP